jgi:hypothetical protein
VAQRSLLLAKIEEKQRESSEVRTMIEEQEGRLLRLLFEARGQIVDAGDPDLLRLLAVTSS